MRTHRQRFRINLGLRAIVGVKSRSRLGLALCVGALGQLLESSLVRLGDLVLGEGKFGLEPLGASYAVVSAEAGKIF